VGSGVGLAAVQLTRVLGAIPYGTSRTTEKVDAARRYGLEDGVTLPGDPASLADRVAAWTSGRGVDVVLELVGGNYVPASLAALAPRGRLVLIGTLAGARTTLDLGHVLRKRLTVRGTVLRSRPLEERILATLAACEAAPTAAPTAGLSGSRPQYDASVPTAGSPSARGAYSFTFATNEEHVTFHAAQINVDGTAEGRAQFRDKTARTSGQIEINCLTVVGTLAAVSGIVTHTNNPSIEGFEALFQVVDNGKGKDSPPDLASPILFHLPGIGPDCRIPGEADFVPIDQGDIEGQP
jgi:hypothetical protein